MGNIFRRDFSRGWLPSADAVNCPKNALLRMDNCVLDELGIVSLRQGSSKINSTALTHTPEFGDHVAAWEEDYQTIYGIVFTHTAQWEDDYVADSSKYADCTSSWEYSNGYSATSVRTDTDVHSLFTAYLSGTRYRMAGANNNVYANSVSLGLDLAGSGDIVFGSAMGQIFFARSTSKKKYDGTTVRNWGIAQPVAAPTPVASVIDSKTFSACNSADYANWTQNEGTKSDQISYIQLISSTTTARGTITKTFGTPQDFTTYDGGSAAGYSDVFQFYFLVTEPQLLQKLLVQIDVNLGDFTEDYYEYVWDPKAPIDTSALQPPFTPQDFIDGLGSQYPPEAYGLIAQEVIEKARVAYEDALQRWQEGVQQSYIKPQLSSSEFNIISAPKQQFSRVGGTTGKNWSTVKAIPGYQFCWS